MLTLEKSRGSTKLGRREKSILLLMLKSDDPPGKPNPIWFDIYKEFGLNYNSLPKKYQTAFQEERLFRQSIHRLAKKALVKPISIAHEDYSLPDPRGYGYIFYCLTPTGRLTAKKLQKKEAALTDQDDFEKAISRLCALHNDQVTTSQVRELLWAMSPKFSSKVEFDKHWNNTKLGLMIRKHTLKRCRIGTNDGRRKYCLATT